ncbi:ATP-binding cassette sub-family C member 2-like [Oppia nitens]|uniref:ATP-binding cassette sub-family C member 2-like n=1 Tax=Oppia nitens TaxID=1686743 RepID=UPI0023DA14B5|nr:ATP-binding cassette sub-family C member 2-like [Oppia nitens]
MFCNTPIWNQSMTWDSNVPQLTQCFQQTILPIIPMIIMLFLLPYDCSRGSYEVFEKANQKYNTNSLANIRLLPLIFWTAWLPYIISALLRMLCIASNYSQPYILGKLIDYISYRDSQLWHGIYYAVIYCFFTLCSRLSWSHSFNYSSLAYYRVQSALTCALYNKMLRLSPMSRREYTTGDINNLMGVDVSEICSFLNIMTNLYAIPISFSIGIFLLWQQLGPSSMTIIVVMLFVCPFTTYAMRRYSCLQKEQMSLKDKRMAQISEILNNIKLLKLFGWEKPFMERLSKVRRQELWKLVKGKVWDCSIYVTFLSLPMFIAGISFTMFTLVSGQQFNAKNAFVSLAVYNLLRGPLTMFPITITYLLKAIVSFRRIRKFLSSEELDNYNNCNDNCVDSIHDNECVVSIHNSSFGWSSDDEPILKDIQINIKKGSLVAIVGRVGAGKSSLLSSLMGDMYCMSGNQPKINGSVAYVPQTAWIQNMTLRNNIVFVSEFESTKYERVITACALKTDFDLLPARDLSEIGEKGINLSGGQKHRVSLARAVYQDTDVYLLDDPLAAVDAHVAQHLFQHVIGPKGLLRRKTRLLATHNIHFLKDTDYIIVMSDGRILDSGTYDELSDRSMLSEQILKNSDDNKSITSEDRVSQISSSKVKRKLSKQTSNISHISSDINDNKEPIGQNLIDEEYQQFGSVKHTVYLDYIFRCGLWLSLLECILCLLYNVAQVGGNYWLTIWTSNNSTEIETTSDKTYYLSIYLTFFLLNALFVTCSQLTVTLCNYKSSTILHKDILFCVLRTPLSFFDTTPLGRIINRFNRDLDMIDDRIPNCLQEFIHQSLYNILILIIIIYSNAYMIILIRLYLWTSRQLNRLNSITRSPIYSHFNESISGAVSIRVYRVQQLFVKRLQKLIDININVERHKYSAQMWIEIWIAIIGIAITFSTALLIVLQKDNISPGLAGFVLMYTFTMVNNISWFLKMTAELETQMVSVERVREYSQLNSESEWESSDSNKPLDNWPTKAWIEFIDYSASYRPELEPVLKNINFRVESGEKVGIVGRTGAGKSSITLALFRIIEPKTGQIIIDGIDITKIGLHDLRSKLTIIPQEPNLFAGTLRLNLDPFEEYSDQQMWTALERSHLKEFISQSSDGLLYEIEEGGNNLSAGQRQLVCLARALLRNTRILILDEATAACDLETDLLIQSTIKEEFSDSTVLTIAHRLNTVLDYNKIIVLDNGMIKEMDSPDNLLRDSDSLFYSLAKEFGIV